MHTNDMAWVSKNCVQVTIPDNATLSDESLRDHLERVAGPISSNGLKRMQRTCDGDRVNIIVRFDREQDVKKLPLDTTHQAEIDGVRQELYIQMCSLKQEKAHMMSANSSAVESDHVESDHGESDYVEPDHGESDHGESDYVEPDHGESDHVESDRGESHQSESLDLWDENIPATNDWASDDAQFSDDTHLSDGGLSEDDSIYDDTQQSGFMRRPTGAGANLWRHNRMSLLDYSPQNTVLRDPRSDAPRPSSPGDTTTRHQCDLMSTNLRRSESLQCIPAKQQEYLSPLDEVCVVHVKGFSQVTSFGKLSCHFENKHSSGGGDIKKMEKEKDVIHVTFSRPGVVKNILSRPALALDGRTLDVSASQEVWDGKSIEVCGLKSSTTHDTVELFFKDFHRSGGGSLEYVHIDTENNVAHLVFEQPEVARMVLSKHTLNLEGATLAAQQSMYVTEWHQRKIDKDSARRDHVTEGPAVLEELQESLDPLDNVHTIHVKGFSQFTSFGALACHFEGKHSSGGGDIEKMEKEKDVIHVTFSRPRVAKRVIGRPVLTLDGCMLDVSASQEVWDGKSIEVRGLKSSTTHDTVELFFEDFRRSGGGSLEYVHIDTENNVAHLVFEQPEVAERVLTKPNLLEGATLTAYQHLLVTEWHQRKMVKNKDGRDHVIQEPAIPVVNDRRGLTPNNIVPTQDVWDGKTIKVHGYDPSAHEDAILVFFESKRRSDGGPVEKVDLDTDNNMAYVTFENTEDAQRVLRHGHLLLEGATLTVQKVMSEESRQRETATESHDNTVDNTEPSSRRLRPSDTAPVMPMWDRKTIKVSGLNPSTRKGTMKLFFTNKRSNGGPIESIDYDTGNNVAYVTFKDTGVAEKVLSKDNLKLEGATLTLIEWCKPPQ